MVNLKLFMGVSVGLFGFCLGLSYWDVVSQAEYTTTMAYDHFFSLLLQALFTSKLRVISVVCIAFCSLLAFGKIVQLIFFGRLRADESRKIHDRVLNYILFKIVFSGVILELLGWEDTLSCVLWFTVLGFLKIFALLCNDRLSFLLTTANIDTSKHIRIFVLLSIIFSSNVNWFCFCFSLFSTSFEVYMILTFECFILCLDTSQTIIKYLIFVVFKNQINWESQTKYMYHTELVTDTLGLVLTLMHYCQVIYMHGISFTLIDAVLFLNMRKVFNRLRQKINSYLNYRKLARAMDSVFPTVRRSDFESGAYDDVCLICRDQMNLGKKLPCSHVFHESCILSWLEQQNTCPTCREPLMTPPTNPVQVPQQGQVNIGPLIQQQQAPGNRFMNWLPRVEIRAPAFNVTQEMVDSVREIAPQVPVDLIRRDLEVTGSVNLTVANIFEGRVQVPDPVEEEVAAPAQQNSPRPNIVSRSLSASNDFEKDDVHSISQEILRLESSLVDAPAGFGSSVVDRQNRLETRKKALQQQSRLRYLKKLQERKEKEKLEKEPRDDAKHEPEESMQDIITTCSPLEMNGTDLVPFSVEDPVDVRRRRAIEAAERRRNQFSI